MLGRIFLNRDVTKRGRNGQDLPPAGLLQRVAVEEKVWDFCAACRKCAAT
jgi:hypothetical protein